MYPNLYYAFKDLFGVEWTGLRFINSFGFFVALAFLSAAYILTIELKRKERAGLMNGEDIRITKGKAASPLEIILNFALGFILGFKIVGLFLSKENLDPQEFIFSTRGNWVAGILIGLIFAAMKWWEKNKQKLATPEQRVIRIWPHDRVGDLVIYAAVFGFLGAKIFHNLENWKEFQANPIEALLSFSGLTFYGGLICAGVAIYFYCRRHKIGFRHLCDAIAPALMLAYAVGRIGCQVSGDGDWGILNSGYVSTPDAKVVPADTTDYRKTVIQNLAFYNQQFQARQVADVPSKRFVAPSWMPDWIVAYNFPNNVIREGVKIEGCSDQYCTQLPVPVYPTAFYETVICLILFAILMLLRTRLTIPGTMFAIYLVLNGVERFLIERIRVNTHYEIFGLRPTQAQLISFALIIAGIVLYIVLRYRKGRATA